MVGFLGWLLVIVGAIVLVSGLRRPAPAGTARADRRYVWGGVAGVVLGLALALLSNPALARMKPVPLSRTQDWVYNPDTSPTAPIHWEGQALVGTLETGSGHYALFPVDWDGNRFEASWDITFNQLDPAGQMIPVKEGEKTVPYRRGRLELASAVVGLMDQNAANVDDRDHVSGSAIEACFSDDVRLRASDANYLVRTASHDESGKLEVDPHFRPSAPVRVELNKKYHCELTYDGGSSTATLSVRDERGSDVVTRRLEDLRDFTNSVSWFGVSIRGYNRFNKKLDPTKAVNGYVRPKAAFRIENLAYRQP